MTDLAVVVGSTRPGRVGEQVAHWVLERAQARTDATFSLVDLAEVDLPPLDEPLPPASGRYSHPWTVAWAQTVDRYDGFLFVTPEYNRGMPGSLKNALDRVCAEWHDKAAAFVSYGHGGGVRAVEQLRQVVGALRLAARWRSTCTPTSTRPARSRPRRSRPSPATAPSTSSSPGPGPSPASGPSARKVPGPDAGVLRYPGRVTDGWP